MNAVAKYAEDFSQTYPEDNDIIKTGIYYEVLKNSFDNDDFFINEIYAVFRFFVKKEHWDKENKNTGEKCKGYPKNIIHYGGNLHIMFMREMLNELAGKECKIYFKDDDINFYDYLIH